MAGTRAKAKVPKGLAATVEAEVARKRARLLASGRADVELIKRRRARIAEDFYDIGEALTRLAKPGVAEALGHASFDQLCAAELSLSATRAGLLMGIVRHVTRTHAVSWGQERTAALIELADATPAEDSAETLARGRLRLPSGKLLDVVSASTNEIKHAAKLIRGHHGKRGRGRTTTPEERGRAARLQAKLRQLGVAAARVTALATRPGQGAHVRIEFVPVVDLPLLKRAL